MTESRPATHRDDRRGRLWWVTAYAAGWLVVTLFLFSRDLIRRRYAADPIPWQTLLSAWSVGIAIVALAGPLVLAFGRRYPIDPRVWGRRVFLHAIASVVFGVLTLGLEAAFDWYTGSAAPGGPSLAGRWARLVVFGLHGNVVLYWLIVGLQAVFDYYRRYRQREREALELSAQTAGLEAALATARLNALKMQLQPHFLFNSLNAVVALVRQGDMRRADDTLGKLGDLLRQSLSETDVQEVSLRRELDYVGAYLEIQRIRFADRIQVTIDVPEDLADAAVPHLALQPIVENAVRYAVEQRATPGRIVVMAWSEVGRLSIVVSDDGPGFGRERASGGGLGLANVADRLRHLYGDAASLHLANGPAGGAVVTLVLPFRLVEASSASPTKAERP